MKKQQGFRNHIFIGHCLSLVYMTILRLLEDAIWRGLPAKKAADVRRRIDRLMKDTLFVKSAMDDALFMDRGANALMDNIYFGGNESGKFRRESLCRFCKKE
jgi:hypothetical protein